MIVEEHEHHRLEQGHGELLGALVEPRAQDALGERVLPHEAAATVLAKVKVPENVLVRRDLHRKVHLHGRVSRPVPVFQPGRQSTIGALVWTACKSQTSPPLQPTPASEQARLTRRVGEW